MLAHGLIPHFWDRKYIITRSEEYLNGKKLWVKTEKCIKLVNLLQKVWFWVLAVILIIIIGSALNGGSDSNKASDNGGEKVTKSSTSASSSKEEKAIPSIRLVTL